LYRRHGMKQRSGKAVPIISALALFTVVVFGCLPKRAQTPRVVTDAERRAELLEKLNRRFEDAQTHYELARSFKDEGLWDRAEYHLETALRFDPAHRGAQAALVRLLIETGRAPEAERLAAMYTEQVAGSAKESLKLGKAFGAERLDGYALSCYKQVLEVEPDSAEAYRRMGYLYLGTGDKERAKECFKQSFTLDPRQAEVAAELGRLGVEVKVVPEPGEENPG